jgi:WD40 repeat protein
LVARRARENGAPRIVSALFWAAETDFYPLFVLENGQLQRWDVSGDELHLFPWRRRFRQPSSVSAAALSPERALLATGHESGQVRLQRLEPGFGRAPWKARAVETIEAHRGCVLSLAAAQTRLYSAGSDGTVVLTSLTDAPGTDANRSEVILEGFSALSCLAVSPDGRWLALGADDGQVQMWRLGEDGTPARLDWTSGQDQSRVKSLKLSPNGHMLLSRNARGAECLWAAQSGHRLPGTAAPNSPLASVFAADSRLLASADASGQCLLFDAWTGRLRHTLPPLSGEVQALAFAPANESGARETLLIVTGAREIVAWKVSF